MTKEEQLKELKRIHNLIFESAKDGMLSGIVVKGYETGTEENIILATAEVIVEKTLQGDTMFLAAAAYAFARGVSDTVRVELELKGIK